MTFCGERMNKLLGKILSAVYPEGITCYVCGAELDPRDERDLSICPYCLGQFKECADRSSEVLSLYEYESVRDIVINYKDNAKSYLYAPIARLMVRYFAQNPLQIDVVCYVPDSKKNARRRGFDHMELIAKEFCRLTGLPLSKGLKRTSNDVEQPNVSAEERFNNVRNSFTFSGNDLMNKSVLLLDDLVTTGATLSACKRALGSSFPASITSLTFARA